MNRAKDVDEYIAHAPKDIQDKLRELRKLIKETAPDAEEKISYGMPYYGYKGRLAYFAYFKNHIGLYAMPPVLHELENDLKKYRTATATIHFPLDEALPSELIKKLVKAGMRNNEAKQQNMS